MSDATPDSSVIKAANAERIYYVDAHDFPVSCPMPDMVLWSAHPKVYLPVETTGEARCPYCSARFVLKEGVATDDDRHHLPDQSQSPHSTQR